MGEFVEGSLEVLLPVFEQLGSVELLKLEEVNGFVKKCRRYEYRLAKRQKSPQDFQLYGDYLNDVITMIRSRRNRQNYFYKRELIEKPLLQKISSIYRRCCERFPGNYELWKKLIAFLDRNAMGKDLSKAYTRALQVHGRNVELRVESALWEFFTNASAENGRAQLQLAIRMSPDEYKYYDALFRLEVCYVDKIMQRRKFLQDNKTATSDGDIEASVYDVDVSDAVLQLRIPEIVLNNAIKAVSKQTVGSMLISMKKCFNECKYLPQTAVSRLNSILHDKIVALNNEDTQLYFIQEAISKMEDEFDAYEKALINLPTERMHRLFLQYCDNRMKKMKDDPLALIKRKELLAKMLAEGWINDKDVEKITELIDEVVEDDSKILLEKALKINPRSPVFWSKWLEFRLENESFETDAEKKSFLDEVNTAFEKVTPEEAFPIWEISLDFAIRYTPDLIEKVFTRAFKVSHPSVASKLKIVRIGYLKALLSEGKIQRAAVHEDIKTMMSLKPNDSTFYIAIAEQEMADKQCDNSLVKLCFNLAITENGQNEILSWMEFIRYSMTHDPVAVSQLYQRALLRLDPSLCAEFIASWTALQQEETTKSLEKEPVTSKRALKVETSAEETSATRKRKRT